MNGLPRPPPAEPLATVRQWLRQAESLGRRNPNAMALASADPAGRPGVRMVLLKELSEAHGFGVFFTHYGSRKGLELSSNPRAAAALYWPELGRQVRLEGPVTRSPAAESDDYFARRPFSSRISATVSRQSSPISDPAELKRRAQTRVRELEAADQTGDPASIERADAIERPPFWGGFRIWFDTVELWAEGADRLHERLRYRRELRADDEGGFEGYSWTSEWLQP
jgi:pyridoxamine 5'-phosphate oxidase